MSEAASNISLNIPLVVRLAGTNVNEGRNIIGSLGETIILVNDIEDADIKVSNLAK